MAIGAWLVSAASLAATPAQAPAEPARETDAAPASAASPPAGFYSYCAVCHGVDGGGIEGLGAALAGSTYVKSAPVGELVEFLKVGRLPNDAATVSGRPMPGFAYVDEAELRAIADYLKQLNRP